MRCPDGTRLAAWGDAELSDAEANRIAAHVGGCDRCAALVHEHDQVKRRTRRLAAAPSPDDALLSSLLTVPAAEHARQRADRCGTTGTGPSRRVGTALAAGVGTGLVAVAWLAPAGVGAPTARLPGDPQQVSVQRVPDLPPEGSPATAPVTAVRWSPSR